MPAVPDLTQPVGHAERVEILDVLRGFAILGILLYNIGTLSGYDFLPLPRAGELPASSLDGSAQILVRCFVHGKFYSLFSLLFGVGFAVLMQRTAAGAPFVPVFKRRLLGLLAIGVLHSLLIWFGDILHVYALLGFLLIPFRRASDRTLLRWSVAMLALPVLWYALALAVTTWMAHGPAAAPSGGLPPFLARAIDRFAHGSYVDVVKANAVFTAAGWIRRLVSLALPRFFGMFLLGFYAGRRDLFRDVTGNLELIRAACLWGLALGLPVSAFVAILPEPALLAAPSVLGLRRTALDVIGTPALCLFYTAGLMLLFQRPGGRRWLSRLAPVGRAALTNYVLQSLTCVVIFYGIGLGLFMRVSLSVALLLAVGIFLAQMLLSRWWMTRFEFGPVEWVWRQVTYRKRLALRRRRGPNASGTLETTA